MAYKTRLIFPRINCPIVNVRPNVRFTLSSAQTEILFQNIMLFFAVAYYCLPSEKEKGESQLINMHNKQ